MIEVAVRNQYVCTIACFIQEGSEWLDSKTPKKLIKQHFEEICEAREGSPLIYDIPGIGEILVDYLGTKVVPGHKETAPKSVEWIEVDKEKHKYERKVETYKYGVLIRYAGVEVYCKSDNNSTWKVNLEIDQFGTLSVKNLSEGAYAKIKIPEFNLSKFN